MRKLALILFAATMLFTPTPSRAFTMDAQGGIVNPVNDIMQFNMSFYGHLWYPIDQMLFVGLGGGYQEIDNVGGIPVSGSVWVRLPIGSQILPVGTGDFGYMFGDNGQMFWRAGGGFDIKNGDYSSVLLMGGYQFLNDDGRGYVYLHAGILIEI
ncbi:MAG: hypothetical protein HUK21_09215 [Fibrobacteraceae bacterium]|nr:hypothetical protein [Fibrobacteraceae bacterium]